MIKKSMILVVITIGLISACGDKKPKEVKVDTAIEKARTELNEEALKAEAEFLAKKQSVKDSLRTVDSLEQVKSHGHAH